MSTPRMLAPMGMAALLAMAVTMSACADDAPAARPSLERGLIVLGVDGMDPRLVDKYMRAGKLPNLAALARRGSYQPLGTSNPPQSPVAWSTFITGMDSHDHGIYDFVHRDPADLSPYLSTSRTEEPSWVLRLGPWALPLSSGTMKLLRAGRAFWQELEDGDIPATVVKIPANFPPAKSSMNESTAGMGTPDLLGTYGTFQLYTDDPAFRGRKVSGGVIHDLDFGDGQSARAALNGPPNPMSATGEIMRLDVKIIRDRKRDVALVRMGSAELILEPGEWSEWVPLGFDPGMLAGEYPGMVRLYLAELRPHLRLYVSPINLDPFDPAMPLSSPDSYVTELAEDIGRFYTQGMPEDTKALAAGALTDAELLSQGEIVFQERLKLLERELARYDGGVLFFYFSSIDQLSHVFWRSIEPDASPEDARYAHVIPDLYERIDGIIGEVIDRVEERAGPGVDVIVMSDHGFASYRYKVHLNTWLAQRGYLSLLPAEEIQPGPLGHIDWSRTQAYALGLNQLFINLAGREAHGVVQPGDEYEVLLRRLTRELEGFRDPDTGASVVTDVSRPEPGTFADRAPDLLVGYNRGYRSSDESAMGQVGEEVIERNRGKWSGDHCMDPAQVPGVLFTTRPIAPDIDNPTLKDLAPTILAYFGVTVPEELGGRPLWNIEISQASQQGPQ